MKRGLVAGFCFAVLLAGALLVLVFQWTTETSTVTTADLSLFEAVVLGVVEGATEYLPVSSTGHLIIVQRVFGRDRPGGEAEAANALAICIQTGAILAVLLLYFRRFGQMFRGLRGGDRDGLRLVVNLAVAFLPAAVLGLLLHEWIKANLFGVLPVAAALFVGGLLILLVAQPLARRSESDGKDLEELTIQGALMIGIAQCLAFWPGFSRSLATILGCVWVGLRLPAAVEFSFLLGLVTLSAATVFEGMQHGPTIIAHYGIVSPLVSLAVAFLSAIVSVRFMVGILAKYGLSPFGYYRIGLAALCLLWLL